MMKKALNAKAKLSTTNAPPKSDRFVPSRANVMTGISEAKIPIAATLLDLQEEDFFKNKSIINSGF